MSDAAANNPTRAVPSLPCRCTVRWPDGSVEQANFIAQPIPGQATIERDDLEDNGKHERACVPLAWLEFRARKRDKG